MGQSEFVADMRTIYQREAWVEEIFQWVKTLINNYRNTDISTCSALCTTSLKNSYVRGRVFPFINIPVRYKDKELLGLYEYCGEQWPLSDQHIYCDFIVHCIYYAENKDSELMSVLEKKAREYFKAKDYDIVQFYDGMATIIIDRKILEQEEEFSILLHALLEDALNIQNEIC